jgi:hypothetical protein
MDYSKIIKELQGILDNLCGYELNDQGREYIRKRIAVYKMKENEARILKDSTATER